jgi:hypothetical protein
MRIACHGRILNLILDSVKNRILSNDTINDLAELVGFRRLLSGEVHQDVGFCRGLLGRHEIFPRVAGPLADRPGEQARQLHIALTILDYRLTLFNISDPSRLWRNWQTRWTQNPVIVRSCRFNSCQPHPF